MKNIVIFASGNGTNAENIIKHFKNSSLARVALVVSNKPDANVLEKAKHHHIPTHIINNEDLVNPNKLVSLLKDLPADLIILAGFLRKIPDKLLVHFPNRILNIHPALLPKYGGKGMYGKNVHEAVIASGDKESGISIHYINSHYDEGEIVLQKKCTVTEKDTSESLAQKVHRLEYEWYPVVIEKIIREKD